MTTKSVKIHITLLALILFSFKWVLSFYFFDDDISIKIIFDTPDDGYFYYIFSKALANFTFNYSFEENNYDLNNLPIPFYAVLVHSILISFFNHYSVLIIEFISIFLFLYILYKIFLKLDIKPYKAILFSIIYYSIPTILEILNLDNVNYIKALHDIYGLRFPRPLITSLFFYIFIYYLIAIDYKKFFNHKNFITIGLLFSITLSSFYYYFILQIISLFILIIINFKIREIVEIHKVKYYFTFVFSFIIFSLPFIYFIATSENDYLDRMYVVNLDLEKKIQLIKYLLTKIFSFKVIFIVSLITAINITVNKIKFDKYKKINIFFIIFISSLFAPLIFILISNKSGLIYHFINLIVISAFLYFFILMIIVVDKFLSINRHQYKIFYTLISFFLIIYNFNIYKNFQSKINNNNYVEYRKAIYESTKIIKKQNNVNSSVLTFEPRLMVWSIMNGVKYLKPISGQLAPKKHTMIENDLIYTFKFLNLTSESFLDFFKNNFSSWRLFNKNTQLFFWGKYTANQFKTHGDKNDYTYNEKIFIQKISPLVSQSLAIPLTEYSRLRDKFDNVSFSSKFNPDLIVLNKQEPIFKDMLSINGFNFCKKISNNQLSVFIKKNNKC